MYYFTEKKPDSKDISIGLVAIYKVAKNTKLHHDMFFIWKETGIELYRCHAKNVFSEKFKTIDEAISFGKAQYDPFQDAIDRINKMVDKRVAEARHIMHLRMAEFRGTLFKYGTWLKANNIHIGDLALVGSKVLCVSDNNYNAYRRYHFPNKGKVYTIASYINLPRGKGITLEEIDFPIIAVNNRTTPKEYTPMNAPFLYSRFKPL